MISSQDRRCVAGVMSGTSLDGIDVAIADLQGHGKDLAILNCDGATYPFSRELRGALKQAASQDQISVSDLSQLNVRLAYEYADAVQKTQEVRGMESHELDLVGSHGQTIRHIPDPSLIAGKYIRSTLQIGDPATLAQLLDIPVIGDFRMADMARGGQGAPLVPYFDYVVFIDTRETRGCLNIGGVANLTMLPANAEIEDVYGFDTGPGNLVIDSLCRHYLDLPYDEGGKIAQSGKVNESLLSECMDDQYFQERPPKSTGREYLTHVFLDIFHRYSSHLSSADIIATATALTAKSIWHAYQTFIMPNHRLNRLILSGGGAHNEELILLLTDYLGQSNHRIIVETSDMHGIGIDSKEALCFAVLAHETANGIPTSIPSVTGADGPAVLGKLCIP